MQRFFVYPEWLDSRNPKDKIEVVKCADHEQALAEKDREIVTLKHDYAQLKEAYDAKVAGVPLGPIVGAQTIINQQIAYQQLMEQAVRFASEWQNPTGYPSQVEAYQFLQSPEVQAWKEHKP